jgi:hypothetical protein
VAHNGAGPGIAKIAPDRTISSFVSHLEPTGLAFDAAGYLFATDYLSNTVLKIRSRRLSRQIWRSIQLATCSSWIVDGIIYEIAPDGTKSTFATGLAQPLGLAFDRSGSLFVADYPNILEFAPDGTRSTFASGIAPWDLAFSP